MPAILVALDVGMAAVGGGRASGERQGRKAEGQDGKCSLHVGSVLSQTLLMAVIPGQRGKPSEWAMYSR